jgi:RND family efflux transporter MFP subunit
MKMQLLLISLTLIACSNQENSKIISLTGHFIPAQSVEIKPLTEGVLEGIHFTEGQSVKEGDLLFTLDKKTYEAKLENAIAKRLFHIKKLQIAAENADRYRSLLLNNYVQEIDYKQSLEELALYETAVMESESEIRLAQIHLDECSIRAPFSGVIGKHFVDKGSVVKETPLALLNQFDPLYIDFQLDEALYTKIKTLLQTEPNAPILINNSEKADLLFIDNVIYDSKVLLRAQINNKEGKFCPGQKVIGTLQIPL